jgi:hypothetical protein
VTTQDKITVIYVRTAVHKRPGRQDLATQEQACRSCAAALGWRVGNLIAHQDLDCHRRAHQHDDRTEKPTADPAE